MKIVESMNGANIFDYSYNRKGKAQIIEGGNSVTTDDNEVVPLDSNLLFQRLVANLDCEVKNDTSQPKLSEVLCYEMASVPASLFSPTTHLMLEPNKSDLAGKIWEMAGQQQQAVPNDAMHVVDGGSLLYRIQWSRGVR